MNNKSYNYIISFWLKDTYNYWSCQYALLMGIDNKEKMRPNIDWKSSPIFSMNFIKRKNYLSKITHLFLKLPNKLLKKLKKKAQLKKLKPYQLHNNIDGFSVSWIGQSRLKMQYWTYMLTSATINRGFD